MGLQRNQKDLTGRKFDKWFVLGYVGDHKTRRGCWLCRCTCGIERPVVGSSLRNHTSRSCGCLQRGYYKRLPDGEAARHMLFISRRKKAHRRKLEWGLSEAEFSLLVKQNCHYCDAPPTSEFYYQPGGKYKAGTPYFWNGLDRMDSSRGYTSENVVSCCSTCNKAKLAMPRARFLEWIDRVYRFQHQDKVAHA